MSRVQFLMESREEGIVYMVVALGESPSMYAEFPHEVHLILTNFRNIILDKLADVLPPLGISCMP